MKVWRLAWKSAKSPSSSRYGMPARSRSSLIIFDVLRKCPFGVFSSNRGASGQVSAPVSSQARSSSATAGCSGNRSALRRLLAFAGSRMVGGWVSSSKQRRVIAASSPRRNPVHVAST
jgi:hypothetical protein